MRSSSRQHNSTTTLLKAKTLKKTAGCSKHLAPVLFLCLYHTWGMCILIKIIFRVPWHLTLHWLGHSSVALQLVSLQEAKLLLKEDDELIKEVFDYWSRKRKTCKGGSLIPNVKQEKRDGSSTSDPYVAFRRRTEKMQTRKVCGQENEAHSKTNGRSCAVVPAACRLWSLCGFTVGNLTFISRTVVCQSYNTVL